MHVRLRGARVLGWLRPLTNVIFQFYGVNDIFSFTSDMVPSHGASQVYRLSAPGGMFGSHVGAELVN